MWIRDLDRDELVALAQRTYEKEDWSPDDIRTLRICWEEFEKRGGLNPVMFFRPAYWGVLKFHEIDSGEVDEQFVQMLERTGAAIAPDYREVMRKLAHAAGSSPPCCSGGAIGGSLQESFRPISRTFRPIHRAAFRSQAATDPL